MFLRVINRLVPYRKRSTSRLYIVTMFILLICRVNHEKCWAGRSTSWNQDCWENRNTAKRAIYIIYRKAKAKVTQSCLTLCNPPDCSLPGSCSWNSPGQNTVVDNHSILQGIFPTQRSNPGLPHCRWILYCLSHQGSP